MRVKQRETFGETKISRNAFRRMFHFCRTETEKKKMLFAKINAIREIQISYETFWSF